MADIDLLAALNEGQNAAYSELYEKYAQQLCYFIQSVTANREASEDIVSEAFLRTFRREQIFSTRERRRRNG